VQLKEGDPSEIRERGKQPSSQLSWRQIPRYDCFGKSLSQINERKMGSILCSRERKKDGSSVKMRKIERTDQRLYNLMDSYCPIIASRRSIPETPNKCGDNWRPPEEKAVKCSVTGRFPRSIDPVWKWRMHRERSYRTRNVQVRGGKNKGGRNLLAV